MTGQDPRFSQQSDPAQRPEQTGLKMGRWRGWAAGLLLLLCVLGFALRLINLGTESLWYDETVSVFLAGQPVPELIGHTARDIHPPGYYLVLRQWLLLAGYPTGHGSLADFGLETMAAFLSLAFGVLLIPLTWLLARRLRLAQHVALVAALFVSISPFGVWYSQEVRMYTLGACLGLACLLATLPFLTSPPLPGRRLLVPALAYAVTAAAGLFVLYYSAFLLLAINGLVLPWLVWRWWHQRSGPDDARAADARGSSATVLLTWLAAQMLALVLYLPWIPTAWRQATDPPVPAWRTPPQLGPALMEVWTALSFGQSASSSRFWPLLLLTLGLVVLAAFSARRGNRKERRNQRASSQMVGARSWTTVQAGPNPASPSSPLAVGLLLGTTFGPGLLILLLSPISPLYHVRYMFPYSPTFSILLALGVGALAHWRRPAGRWLAALVVLLIVAGSALSLQTFWTDPAFAADDHRGAVRDLAQRWRPGEPILMNAGYAYPAFLTYWPGALAWNGRISDYGPRSLEAVGDDPGAVLLQVGHIDGEPGLGWDDPLSDFYALPAQSLDAGLEKISAQHPRLWHYRIYDTVNDPMGFLREELANSWILVDDRAYGGEATMRVQIWQDKQLPSLPDQPTAMFDGWLELSTPSEFLAPKVVPGQALALQPVVWRPADQERAQPVALSVRLADSAGQVWASQDEALGGNKLGLDSVQDIVQPLYLEIPAGTPPGTYQLQLVVYDPQTGRPLPVQTVAPTPDNYLSLGPVEVAQPPEPAISRPALANFGPLHLIEATTPATAISPGDGIPLSLLWQAAPDFDSQAYVVVVQLLDDMDEVIASLESEPVAGRLPTSDWQPSQLVRDRHLLNAPNNTPPGIYRLVVGLYRASDGQRLIAAMGPLGIRRLDYFEVGDIEVR